MKIVTGHQPAFLPWVGLLHKVMIADVFIFMDVAKFRKRAFMHRNKIQINDSPHFIGLKLNQESDKQYCHEVSISNSHENNLEEIYNKIIFTYQKYKYFKDLDLFLVKSFDNSKYYLNDICIAQLNTLCDIMDIKTQIIKESSIIDFEITKRISASERLLMHATKTSAKIYITGINSKDYLDASIFKSKKIFHRVQNFNYTPFLKQQICLEPLSLIHQIAQLGFQQLKNELLVNQVNKAQLLEELND